MNEECKNLIIELAKSRTEYVYAKRLDRLRQLNTQWADYLDAKKEQFATVSFLEKGLRRYGKVTSNGVENMNNALSEARSLPIAHQIEAIVRYQQEKYSQRKEIAKRLVEQGKVLTDYATQFNAKIGSIARKKEVQITTQDYPFYKARVSVSVMTDPTGFTEVTADVEKLETSCACRHYEEFGLQCAHTQALLFKLRSDGIGSQWTNIAYHTNTYKEAYGADIPSMAIGGQLKADVNFVPPDNRRAAGRPTKKRKHRSHLRTTATMRTCKACGVAGHFAATCDAPSTQYRYEQHKDKAMAWCKKHEAIELD